MKNLLLIDGDLVLEGGELQLVEGLDELAQEMRVELQTNRGEFFLAPTEGLPFDVILRKLPNQEAIRGAISGTLNKNPRIRRLDEVKTTFNRQERRLDIQVRATGAEGENVTVGVVRNA